MQAEKAPEKRRLRGKLFTHIDADYYGYRDEEDGILVQLEAEAEALSIEQAMAEWEAKRAVAAQGPWCFVYINVFLGGICFVCWVLG